LNVKWLKTVNWGDMMDIMMDNDDQMTGRCIATALNSDEEHETEVQK